MRSVMISLSIMLFCLSMTVVNTINDDYMTATNETLLGWKGEPFINRTQLRGAKDEAAMNETLHKYTTASQNPITQIVDIMWASLTFLLDGVRFLIEVTINTTVGFGKFIQTMGKHYEEPLDCTKQGVTCIIPSGIADVLTVFVCINHILAVLQLVGKFNLKEGL